MCEEVGVHFSQSKTTSSIELKMPNVLSFNKSYNIFYSKVMK